MSTFATDREKSGVSQAGEGFDVEVVQRVTGERDYSFLGYCMGGLFGLMYGGAFPQADLKNLICVATPVDFEGMKLMRSWADPRWFDDFLFDRSYAR